MAIIDKPSDYFNTKLYTGNGSTQSITGVNFQPDWVWIKSRGDTSNHRIYDGVRGATKVIYSNLTNVEGTDPNGLTSFDSDGFSLGTEGQSNGSGVNFASWNWKAGGTAVSNTDGSITSSVSANQDAGFSIVSYTGNGSAGATVGHGLGTVPQVYILKNRSSSAGWTSYFEPLGATKFLQLNTTAAAGTTADAFNNTSPTSSVFSIGVDTSTNQNTANFIAYCFAEKQGYSKFGSYTGNGSTDGTFVYTGFKPAYVMAKKSSTTSSWGIFDNKRTPYNVMDLRLLANTSGADDQSSDNNIDFLSNGFKFRSSAGWNASATYIYMCFAENPFVSSTGVPGLAR